MITPNTTVTYERLEYSVVWSTARLVKLERGDKSVVVPVEKVYNGSV